MRTERDRSLEFHVEEADKDEEDDDLIFRKMNIPWLSDKTSILKEGLFIYSVRIINPYLPTLDINLIIFVLLPSFLDSTLC